MTNVEAVRVSLGGRPKGAIASAPRNPDRILEIVRLRDVENMRWRQIGEVMELSHQAPFLLYQRWRDWAYENYVLKKPKKRG
jgi:hypothetical protein